MDEKGYYFAGDPERDSPRRHMQRVLAESPSPRRHWPWLLGFLAGSGSWTLWRVLRRRQDEARDRR